MKGSCGRLSGCAMRGCTEMKSLRVTEFCSSAEPSARAGSGLPVCCRVRR